MQLLKVQEDGFAIPLKNKEGVFDSQNVIIVVDDVKKRIYIWKGELTTVRKKFVGARAAQKIRFDDMANVTVPVDEGEGSSAEQDLKALVAKSPVTMPVEIKKFKGKDVATKKTQDLKKSEKVPPKATPKIPPTVEPQVPPSPKPILGTPPPREVEITPPDVAAIDARPILAEGKKNIPKAIMQNIDNLKVPIGFSREAIIIDNAMFTLVKMSRSIFGKTTEETELRKMDSPPDGVYLADEMTPRIVIKGSRVVFSEFLKRDEEAIPEHVVDSLDELTKLFAKTVSKSSNDMGSSIGDLLKS
jgi:hypothetical protein